MIITAIRFRAVGTETWQAFKLSPGAGRFRNYQAVIADGDTLRQFVQALDYALAGKEPSSPCEAQVQLSDDGGHTWTLQRRPGFVRYLKDGAVVDGGTAARVFAAALMDLDGFELKGTGGDGEAQALAAARCETFEIRAREGRLTLAPFGAPEGPEASIKQATERQIAALAQDAARLLDVPELAAPKVLTAAARRLEPLSQQFQEIGRQYRQQQPPNEQVAEADKELRALDALTRELALTKTIAEVAGPLLAPAAPTLKQLQDDLAKTEAAVVEVSQALGLSTPESRDVNRDFRKAIEALCRLEAHAKLVRASQGARKYCEQNIEPAFKKYLELAESSLIGDRQVTAELESCLASLTLRLNHQQDVAEPTASAAGPAGPAYKTWFDRFKSRQAHESRQAETDAPAQADLETARMAIEYALGRLRSLGANLHASRSRHESVLGKLDEAHEELVRSFSRLRDHWLAVARQANLPEELDLNGLLRIVAGHGRLATLVDQRHELGQVVRRHAARTARLEQLVSEWRRTTGSQKQVELSNPQVLLQEARDVIRYHEAKKKRLAQLQETQAANRAKVAMHHHFKARLDALMDEWRAATKETGVDGLAINRQDLGQLFQRAHLVRALALVHGAAAKSAPDRLFDSRTEAHAATVYLWGDSVTEPTQRLELLNQLESASGGELRLLLIADEGLGAMLSTLGIGIASRIQKSSGAVAETGAAPRTRQVQPPAPAADTRVNRDAMLTERALRTLNLLTGKK